LGIPNVHVSRAVNDKTLIRVLTTIPNTNASAKVQEPRGVDKKLDPQCGEAQHQIRLPQSFVLTNTICTSMDTSNPKRGLIMIVKLFGSTSRIQAPNSELRAAKLVCQTPLFPTMTLAMIDF
jgi:hypothetical protein